MNTRSLALALLCLLPACGGNSDPRVMTDEGSKELNSGEFDAAAKSFQAALDAIGNDSANSEWKHAKLGLIQVHIHMDAGKAKDEFLTFAAAAPSKVTDQDFSLIGSRLGDANKLTEAIAVLDAGMKAFPESPHLKALGNDLQQRAKSSGATGALDSLKGLGYVGGD
jgi:hypothetical protein